jgi:hypothetical protein
MLAPFYSLLPSFLPSSFLFFLRSSLFCLSFHLNHRHFRFTERLLPFSSVYFVDSHNVWCFFPLSATTCSSELSGLPSWLWLKCNRLLRLGRPRGAVTLSRWCVWWYIGGWNTRRGLKSKSTNYPDHGHHGDPLLQEKIPMVEPGIEPGTSWSVLRDPDH